MTWDSVYRTIERTIPPIIDRDELERRYQRFRAILDEEERRIRDEKAARPGPRFVGDRLPRILGVALAVLIAACDYGDNEAPPDAGAPLHGYLVSRCVAACEARGMATGCDDDAELRKRVAECAATCEPMLERVGDWCAFTGVEWFECEIDRAWTCIAGDPTMTPLALEPPSELCALYWKGLWECAAEHPREVP